VQVLFVSDPGHALWVLLVTDLLGDRAVRFARPTASARTLVAAIREWPGVVDVVVAREDVAVYFAHEPVLVDLAPQIAALAGLRDLAEPGREHRLRVVYDGPDLEEVARATKLSVDDVIAAHRSREYTVALMGFAPGFAYLDGLDPRLELPRRASPRPRVAAGSLAIAGTQTAVYPFAGPGGWHLIGRVLDVKMFDESGPLLALGDRVRFVL
jgi:KipI family sensor histidine kinase inhibitor